MLGDSEEECPQADSADTVDTMDFLGRVATGDSVNKPDARDSAEAQDNKRIGERDLGHRRHCRVLRPSRGSRL